MTKPAPKTHRHRLAWAIAFAIAIVAGATDAGTPTPPRPIPAGAEPWLALAKRADVVVTARLVAKRSYWNARHTLILTDYTLRTTAVLSGDGPATFVVTGEGGEIGDLGLAVSDEIAFQAGATYALLLAHGPNGPSVMGGTAGVWRLRDSDPAHDPTLEAMRHALHVPRKEAVTR